MPPTRSTPGSPTALPRVSPNGAGCELAPPRPIDRGQSTIRLDTHGRRMRYYLLWITHLPPGSETAEISELTLFR